MQYLDNLTEWCIIVSIVWAVVAVELLCKVDMLYVTFEITKQLNRNKHNLLYMNVYAVKPL